MMVRDDRLDIDPKGLYAGPSHGDPCRRAGAGRAAHLRQRRDQEGAVPRSQGRPHWLSKVRPMYGHDYHFHIRMKCPPGSGIECQGQPDPSTSEGCSAGDLAYWFKDSVIHPKPPKVPPKPKPPMPMSALPAACKAVLNAPDAKQ